jgi:hypothetical protein
MAYAFTGQAQGVLLTTSQKSGSPAAVSTGWHNELLKSDLLPRYHYLVSQGVVFGVQYASAATAAASATATGSFGFYNPNGSGVNLVLLDATIVLNSAAAVVTGQAVGMVGVPNQQPTTTTPGNTPVNFLIGSGKTSAAKTYTAGTLVGAPTASSRVWSFFNDVASGAGALPGSILDPLDGKVVIAPNSGIDFVSVANTPTIILALTWAELPI